MRDLRSLVRSEIERPERRRRIIRDGFGQRRCCLAAVGGFALAQLLGAAPAIAQGCSGNPNPSPPAQNDINQSGVTYTPRAPLADGPLPSTPRGCDGADNSNNPGQSGGAGSPGVPGPTFTATYANATVQGTGFGGNRNTAFGATVWARGGDGGNGGKSGAVTNSSVIGGAGGGGGSGGSVTVSFGGTIAPAPGLQALGGGIEVSAQGGFGGAGGDSGSAGIFIKGGGQGGDGGGGGTAALSMAAGSITADAAISVEAGGGSGNGGGTAFTDDLLDEAQGANGGAGGAGGSASATIGASAALKVTESGASVDASGGFGGFGGQAGGSNGQQTIGAVGGNGGAGGRGGNASLEFGGTLDLKALAGDAVVLTLLSATANGGQGRDGAQANGSFNAGGGSGGKGGVGGTASLTYYGTTDATTTGSTVPSALGVLAQANGGFGGLGAQEQRSLSGYGGNGGAAGSGGTVSLTFGKGSALGKLTTTGTQFNGAVAQSIGGGGGNGGSAAGFSLSGGAGANGGNGGAVTVQADNTQVFTLGETSRALIAQSVGGGGGVGGDTTNVALGAALAVGGNGGAGGNGSDVTVTLGRNAMFGSTHERGGAGILAQSVGGAGGAGGTATARGASFFTMTVGGDAAGGGTPGKVEVDHDGLVTTYGDHAVGIQAQSVGGGGGDGGAAITFIGGAVVPTVAVAVGGRGGGGGAARTATVAVSGDGQVSTYGSDAHGVLAQSVGGGGGTGGTAAATAIELSGAKDVPAVSFALGLGGAGGGGNTGNAATATSSGIVTTSGHGAIGIMAQSVGGGGGAGGDSSALAYSLGKSEIQVSVASAIGGSGGTGATAGQASATSSGLVYTLGQDATAVFAQSVGGGGGTGGTGDSSANAGDTQTSVGVAISVGGTGGTGGTGGAATASNSGGLATTGDAADGVFAQSVGGGGGDGNGGTAASSGGTLSVSVGVGGSGGAGGDGGTAQASNAGAIVTYGSESFGIAAQSVGGGGGRGGKAASAPGGSADALTLTNQMADAVAKGLGSSEGTVKIIDGVWEVATAAKLLYDNVKEIRENLTGPEVPEGNEENDGFSPKLQVGVAVGGKGGAAGKGGDVTATNTGEILTGGSHADAVWAQSVGGGGGIGGAASSTGLLAGENEVSVAVGGSGGSAGNGGAATARNAGGATISTLGAQAFGLAAQSVGGGGGRGALSGASNAMLKSVAVSIAGSGATSGSGGLVTVENDGAITTGGKNAMGIFAQSVGGGGGLVRLTDLTQNGEQSAEDSDASDNYAFNLAFTSGGSGTTGGAGGAVDVTSKGPITTAGRGSHAIFAQSVGGGGGAAVGGQPAAIDVTHGNGGGSSGDGGKVTVDAQGAIQTSGVNARGIWAVSIGGGGGVNSAATGNTFDTDLSDAGDLDGGGGRSGNGGAIEVSLDKASITTTGVRAEGIKVQSYGGGGGEFAAQSGGPGNDRTVVKGSFGGAGNGGDITVSLANGSVIETDGFRSIGIWAASDGQKAGDISISIDAQSGIAPNGPAIYIDSGGSGTVANAGEIEGDIFAPTGMPLIINNSGEFDGQVQKFTPPGPPSSVAAAPLVTAGGTLVNNLRGGVLIPGARYDLGDGGLLRNAGTLHIGERGRPDSTTVVGDLKQTETGALRFDLNAEAAQIDRLAVSGKADLDGSFEVVPTSLLPGTHAVLTAGEGVSAEGLAASRTHIFAHTPAVTADSLSFTTTANFAAEGSGDRDELAGHLQGMWDAGGAGFGTGFAALHSIGGADEYADALDSMSARSVAAIGYGRYQSSQWFARAGYSCPRFDEASVVRTEHSCTWMQVRGARLERDADGSDPGFDLDTVITAIGGQAEVQDGWFVGGALGWENSDLSDDFNTSVDGDALLSAATVKHERGPWTFSGAFDLGYGSFDSSRRIRFGTVDETAEGSSNALNAGLHFRAAYEMPRDGWYAEPAVDVDLNYIRLDDYRETGAGAFDLAVDSSDTTVLTGTPWIKVGRRSDFRSGSFDAYTSAGVSLSAGQDLDVTARFADAPPGTGDFTTALDNPNVIGRISAGVEFFVTERIQLRLQYDGSFADNQTENAGQVRLSYFF